MIEGIDTPYVAHKADRGRLILTLDYYLSSHQGFREPWMDLRISFVLTGICYASAPLAVSHTSAEFPSARPDVGRQVQLLVTPSESQLAAEQRGRVFIYDFLEIGQVNVALNKHFERIQNMMFVRIHQLPPTGAGPYDVEEDGCD